jgi:hypothetical protein
MEPLLDNAIKFFFNKLDEFIPEKTLKVDEWLSYCIAHYKYAIPTGQED